MAMTAVRFLTGIAALLFVSTALHEFNYARAHPYAYGPANWIAAGALGGVCLAVAVYVLTYALEKIAHEGPSYRALQDEAQAKVLAAAQKAREEGFGVHDDGQMQ